MTYLLEDMTRDQLLALCKRWERAHCDAGIMGSEYYIEPERVFEYVGENRRALTKALLKAKEQLNERQNHNPVR